MRMACLDTVAMLVCCCQRRTRLVGAHFLLISTGEETLPHVICAFCAILYQAIIRLKVEDKVSWL